MVGYSPEVVKSRRRKLTKFDYGLAGAASGAMTRVCVQPLDVLKIRFQLQEEPIKRGASLAKYHSVVQAAGSILREEGPSALWKGHVPAQALSVVYGVAQFVTFEMLTYFVYPVLPTDITTGSWKPVYHFVCGGVAGCVASVASLPIDIVRTRLVCQGEPKIYPSIASAVRAMYKEGGVRTFYKGLTPTLLQLFPQAGLNFGFYAFFTKMWDKKLDKSKVQVSGFQSLICGGLAGVCSKSLVYPFDVFKKRLQVQGFEEARRPFGHVSRYDGLLHCVRTMAEREGVRGLFKGLSPSLLKAFCSTGLHFATYEMCCKGLSEIER